MARPADSLRDRFETTDGARPEATPLGAAVADELPLSAFAILAGGDLFEGRAQPAASEDGELAARYVEEQIELVDHTNSPTACEQIGNDIRAQLGQSADLARRMLRAKPLRIDVVTAAASLRALGFPRNMSPSAAGVFWDHPKWKRARIALRRSHLEEDPALVFHEMGHAVHYLGLGAAERDEIYAVLRPTFGSRAAMDEVFAIYGERELAGAYSSKERRAPGIYGFARRQWSEDHLFTRFIRKLYFPRQPSAGPQMKPLADGDWMGKIGRG